MRVKITQSGWENYNGDLGMVQFVDGVSAGDMSRTEALALGAFITIVELDDSGDEIGQISPAVDLLRTKDLSAEVIEPLQRGAEGEAPEKEQSEVQKVSYTEEDLAAVATEKGIAGLRAIAKPFGVKDTSVRGLIEQILSAQKKAQA